MHYALGNKALSQTPSSGEMILLFHTQPGRVQRYFGRMELIRTWTEPLPDETGSLRKAILFELTPVGESFSSANSAPRDRAGRIADLRRRAREGASATPGKRTRESVDFERSPAVVAYARARADGTCEACGKPAPFPNRLGEPFLVCHHIRSLADEGADDLDAVGAICPNCHYHIHYGQDGATLNDRLREVVLKKETGPTSAPSAGGEATR